MKKRDILWIVFALGIMIYFLGGDRMVKLKIWKEGQWVHATREDVAKYQPHLLQKGVKVWTGDKWISLQTTLKDCDTDGN